MQLTDDQDEIRIVSECHQRVREASAAFGTVAVLGHDAPLHDRVRVAGDHEVPVMKPGAKIGRPGLSQFKSQDLERAQWGLRAQGGNPRVIAFDWPVGAFRHGDTEEDLAVGPRHVQALTTLIAVVKATVPPIVSRASSTNVLTTHLGILGIRVHQWPAVTAQPRNGLRLCKPYGISSCRLCFVVHLGPAFLRSPSRTRSTRSSMAASRITRL